MIYEYAILTVDPADAPAFDARIPAARAILLRSPGCTSAEIRPTLDRPGGYLMVVGWRSIDDHLIAFAASAEAAELNELIGALFADDPVVVHVEG